MHPTVAATGPRQAVALAPSSRAPTASRSPWRCCIPRQPCPPPACTCRPPSPVSPPAARPPQPPPSAPAPPSTSGPRQHALWQPWLASGRVLPRLACSPPSLGAAPSQTASSSCTQGPHPWPPTPAPPLCFARSVLASPRA
eukprot:2147094-Rhodomonas_salina.2